MDSQNNDKENVPMDNQEFYVRYKIKDSEMEAKGDRDHVNQHAMALLTLVADGKPIQLPNPVEKETPLLVHRNGVSPNVSGDNSLNHKPLPTLYREKSPKSQPDQILVITYFYK